MDKNESLNFFLKLWSLITLKEKKIQLFLLILMIISILFEMLGIGMIIPILTLLLNDELIINNDFYKYFKSTIKVQSDDQILFIIVSFTCFIFIFKNLFLALVNYFMNYNVYNIAIRLSTKLYQIYICSPYSFHSFHIEKNSAILMHNIAGEIGQIRSSIQTLLILISEILLIVGIGFLLLYHEPIATSVIIISAILIGFLINYFSQLKIDNWGKLRILNN